MTSGTNINSTTTCENPVPDGGTAPPPLTQVYTATATSLTTFRINGATTVEFTFTKQ